MARSATQPKYFYYLKKRPHNYRHIRFIHIIYVRFPSIMSSYLSWAEKRGQKMPRTFNLSNSAQQRNVALQLKDRGR